MAEVRAAIIGSGGMAYARAAHLAGTTTARLACISSRNHVTGATLAARNDVPFVEAWQAAVQRDDVDAVFVTTHNDSHAPIAQAALEAGKHVFVEYPLALTLADADQMIATAAARQVVLQVGHDQAFVGWQLAIKEQSQDLGQLQAMTSVLCTPSRGGGRSVWRSLAVSGPPLMVGIAYVYHLLDTFGDAEWVEGTAQYQTLEDENYYRACTSTMMMQLADGGVAHVLYVRGFAVPRDEQEQAMVFDRGFLSFRGYESGSPTNAGQLIRVTQAGSAPVSFPNVQLGQASRRNTENFLASVLNGAPVDPPVRLARQAIAVALAQDEAARSGRRVPIR